MGCMSAKAVPVRVPVRQQPTPLPRMETPPPEVKAPPPPRPPTPLPPDKVEIVLDPGVDEVCA